MNASAHVSSMDAVKASREALCGFKAVAQEALCALDIEVRRAYDWLDERLKYWQQEVRRREEMVVEAKNALMRRKMQKTVANREPDCTTEEKALRKAQAFLQQAEDKVKACRRWKPALHQAVEEYQSQGRRLGGMLDADVPRALVLFEQKLAALEGYMSGGGGPIRSSSPAPAPAPAPAPQVKAPSGGTTP